MSATGRRAELTVVEETPKLIVTHGRGGTGKSTFARLLIERAHETGRPPTVADADRTNATLPKFFDDVLRPPSTDDKSVTDWLDAVVNAQAEQRVTVVLDMGGGDQVFKRFAIELQLVDMLLEAGIEPVALHMLGPDLDDLAYLRDIEDSTAFCPPHTALVLNEGLIRDSRPREVAFTAVRDSPAYRAAVKRGCVEIWFPRLGCMAAVNGTPRLSFGRAAEAGSGLGLTNRQRVWVWRRQAEASLAPIAAWLP